MEANTDPLAIMMGPAFASVSGVPGGSNPLLEVHERLTRERARGNEGETTDEMDSSFRLLLLINSLDLKLLHSSVKELGKGVRLSPEAVETELDLLQQFSGEKDNSCLKEIKFTSEVVFSNGCRAAPWRQVMGDICYISVQPFDGNPFCVTASTEGYYVNKGMKASGEVNAERAGDVFTTLVGLLKATSQHFAINIGKQEFIYTEDTGGSVGEDSPPEVS